MLLAIPVCCIVLIPAASHAQVSYADPGYVIDYWGTEDGLPVNHVVQMLQSEQGYLWLATYDGLVRFDGFRFKVYQSENYPGLPSNRLINLFEAPDGSLWMETEQQFVIKFHNGKFYHIREEDGLNGEINYATHQDYNGDLWFASNGGISVYRGGKLTPYYPDLISGAVDRVFLQRDGSLWFRNRDSDQIYRFSNGNKEFIITDDRRNFLPFYEDESGEVWFGSGLDIYHYKDDTLTLYTSLKPEAQEVISIGKHSAGRIWVLTYSNGFYRLREGGAIHFEPSGNETYSFFYPFYTDYNRQFWKFSRHTVWRENKAVLNVTNGINSYTFDHEGNIWIGTSSDGLIRIKPNPFEIFSAEEGLPNRNIYPVLEDREGTIWVGTHGDGIARIADGIVYNDVHIERHIERSYVNSLYETSDGKIYASLLGGGLYEREPGSSTFKKNTTIPEIGEDLFAIYEQDNGDFWLGTGAGIFLERDGQWFQFNQESGFTNHPVRYFLEAPDGALWMATNGAGLTRYFEGEFEVFNIGSGFASNLVRSLHISPGSAPDDYLLWVGTEDRGLIRLQVKNHIPDLQHATTYSRHNGMLDYVIHIILEDDNDNFWFNTNRGIFYLPKKQLEAFHRGDITEVEGIAFNESDGLRNREGNGGMQSPGIRASDGRFWFPGQDGVAVVDPASLVTNEQIPSVIIEELESGERLVQNYGINSLELDVNERDFEIRYTGLSLTDSEKNQFRYRLAGFNDNWIEAGERRSAVYTNIPAGTYTFEVIASNNTGVWNTDPAVLSIVIAPYFYETAWFRFLIAGLIIIAFIGGIQWRVKKLKQREIKLKKLVDERTEQLRLEKQKTQEQANSLKELDKAKTRFFTNISHEFRTPLTLIMSPLQRMLTSGKKEFDESTQKEFRRMLRNSDRLLRLIDQTLELTRLEHGKLKLHVQEIDLNKFAGDLTELFDPICIEKKIKLTFHPEESETVIYADPDKLDKMIANLLSNAIKFTPTGGTIMVKLKKSNEYTDILVTDTGIGISEPDLENIFDRFYQVDSSETRSHEGSGVGLSLAYEFAALHKGELLAESKIGEGSTFTLRLKNGRDHFTKEQVIETGQRAETLLHKPERAVVIGITNSTLKDVKDEDDNDPSTGDAEPADQTSVLVVEDNADLRSYISAELADEYRVMEASNGMEALKNIRSNLPDLIIADIMMPEMDGITFNRKLKDNPGTASIPVIFLTAKATKENKLSGLDEGADDYITKPFDPQLLKARVRNLIETRFRLRKLLLGEEAKKKVPAPGTDVDPFMEKVTRIIEEQYADPGFNVATLADQLYLDRSQVTRKLKKISDTSPGDLIKKYRMEKAGELLQEQAGTISEIAYATGFNSLAYFSFSFKDYYGVTPSGFSSK